MSNKDHQPTEIVQLIHCLEQASELKGKGKAIKKTFQISGTQRNVISWKFNEWDYGKDKIQLPSNARGLFTLEDEPVLAVRGYDKFFNINEVYFTRWDWLSENTKGPYVVTSKENGCIILVSGLEDGTLVVCSKHSTGSRDDVERNHATSGQDFLRAQLEAKGATERQFAMELYKLNATAVFELCDDNFEEHILEYKGDDSGLYLHGLNFNQPIFKTLDIETVHKFSTMFGFKTIDYFKEDSLEKLKEKLDEYSKVGSYKGKEIEGFVIRCKLQNDDDYFFKFKFEEPYLMYRQWREVTRTYLNKRHRSELKFNKHKFITNKYLDFVIPILEAEPQTCEDYVNGKGQIELRQRFLRDYGMTGSEILNQERLQELEDLNAFDKLKIDEDSKFIFVPIATIGCGKTTTSMTLTELFPDIFDIVINDNISKQNKGDFVRKPLEILKTKKKAVFMDRNNHQYRERKQIFEDINGLRDDYLPYSTNLQFIALNFVTDDSDEATLWQTTKDRVFKRGDNHQSIKVVTDGKKKVESIMAGFLKRFQPIDTAREPDSLFDFVIDMKVGGNSSLDNAKHIIDEIHKKYPILIPEIPSTVKIDEAFNKALNYKPTFTKTFGNGGVKKEKTKKPVYFSTKVNNIPSFLKQVTQALEAKGKTQFLDTLRINNRVQPEFHVTLAHVNQSKAGSALDKQLWDEYLKVYGDTNPSGKCKVSSQSLNLKADVKLKSIGYDTKGMAVHVELIKIYDPQTGTVMEKLKCANKIPHITIGTAAPAIKPFYSNELLRGLEVYNFQEGDFDGFNVVHFDQEVVLDHLDVIVNY